MDVRCERCKTEYEFDEARITEAGVTVKCTTCEHVFRVKKKTLAVVVPTPSASAPPPEGPSGSKPKEWKLRQTNGSVLTFKELTTLQKWIVERKVTQADEISVTGENWKSLGSIVELSAFFQIVDEADRAKQAAIAATPPTVTIPHREEGFPVSIQQPRSGRTQPEFLMSGSPPESQLHQRGSGPWSTLLILLALVLAGALYWAFVVKPQQEEKRLQAEAAEAARQKREDEVAAARKAAQAAQAQAAPPPVVEAPAVDAGVLPPPATADAGAAPAAVKPLPQDFDSLMTRADSLRERGKIDQALDIYGKAADLEPHRAEPMAGRGLVFLDRGSFAQAEAAFRQALKANTRYGVAIMGLAETYRAQGKSEEALAQYERYLEVLPEGPEANVARNAVRQLKQ